MLSLTLEAPHFSLLKKWGDVEWFAFYLLFLNTPISHFCAFPLGAFPTPTSLDTGGAPGISFSSLPKVYLGIHLGIPNGRSENIVLEMSKRNFKPRITGDVGEQAVP